MRYGDVYYDIMGGHTADELVESWSAKLGKNLVLDHTIITVLNSLLFSKVRKKWRPFVCELVKQIGEIEPRRRGFNRYKG